MKIGVLSDCHEDIATIEGLFKEENDFDHVFFLGDGIAVLRQVLLAYDIDYTAVKGNNDRGEDEAFDRVVELCGHRFLLTHGHRYHVGKNKCSLLAKAKETNCCVALFGHTHVPFYEKIDGITLFNPGSTFYGRQGYKKSYGILLLEKDSLEFVLRTL